MPEIVDADSDEIGCVTRVGNPISGEPELASDNDLTTLADSSIQMKPISGTTGELSLADAEPLTETPQIAGTRPVRARQVDDPSVPGAEEDSGNAPTRLHDRASSVPPHAMRASHPTRAARPGGSRIPGAPSLAGRPSAYRDVVLPNARIQTPISNPQPNRLEDSGQTRYTAAGASSGSDAPRAASAARQSNRPHQSASAARQSVRPPSGTGGSSGSEGMLGPGRANPASLAPVAQFGRYELLGRLAYGGMAEVFLAREAPEVRSDRPHSSGRLVVVKRVLPHAAREAQFIAMFQDEARLAMRLTHPNICHIYAFGEEQGAYFLAMEWVNGMTLSRVVRRAGERGGLPLHFALKIIGQIAEALDYAHRANDSDGKPIGIVHRDVSPQNIMVAFDGPVKLLDFGIAKASTHDVRTESGIIKGKFAYMSPQQCLGEPIDGRSDVFALGVCLLEALIGRNPFRRQTEFDTMRALVYDPIPPLGLASREPRTAVCEAIESIVHRALAKQPKDRFQTAGEMQIAIEETLAKMGEVVTSAKLGDLMGELFAKEIQQGPELDQRHAATPAIRTGERTEPSNQRMRWPVLLGIGILVLASAVAVLLAVSVPERPSLGVPLRPTEARALPEAPGAEAEVPTYALLTVESEPSGAEIHLGARGLVGTTPMEMSELEPGTWLVSLRREGFENWEQTLELRAGERARVFGALRPSVAGTLDATLETSAGPRRSGRAERDQGHREVGRGSGRLSLNTRPWSRVYIGSRLLGTTPLGDVELRAGTVRLRLVDRDGEEHNRTVRISPNGHAQEFFDLRSDPEPD